MEPMRLVVVAVLACACVKGNPGSSGKRDAAVDAPRADAARDAARDAAHDATADAFACANDSAIEPNESIAASHDTGVATTQSMVTLSPLAICPAGDKDFFTVTTTVDQQSLNAAVTYDGGSPLTGQIENAGGTPIATLTGASTTIMGTAMNLPIGTYYVEISAASGINNYSLTISVN